MLPTQGDFLFANPIVVGSAIAAATGAAVQCAVPSPILVVVVSVLLFPNLLLSLSLDSSFQTQSCAFASSAKRIAPVAYPYLSPGQQLVHRLESAGAGQHKPPPRLQPAGSSFNTVQAHLCNRARSPAFHGRALNEREQASSSYGGSSCFGVLDISRLGTRPVNRGDVINNSQALSIRRARSMGAGAFVEPLVVVVLLFGGTWVNRDKSYTLLGGRKHRQFTEKLLDNDTAPSPDDFRLPSPSASDSLLEDGLFPPSPGGHEPAWRQREIRAWTLSFTVTSPNTRAFKDTFLSRVLLKFPFLVEAWYWALIYWVGHYSDRKRLRDCV